MQYACFVCRKVFKKPSDKETRIEYSCPECAEPLHMMGNAFRAPRCADESQWQKVQELVQAGILFYRNSGARPKTLHEVPAFLKAQARARQGAGERALERMGASAKPTTRRGQGRLKKLNTEGKPEFELDGRELQAWMRVLVHDGKEWQEGTFRMTGDGGRTVEPHVQIGRDKRIFIGPQTVLRWP